jgi:hypothetical protein
VATDERFWEAGEAGESYELVKPRTGAVVRRERAERILDRIAEMTWGTGEPGVLFIDTVNEHNPTPHLDRIEIQSASRERFRIVRVDVDVELAYPYVGRVGGWRSSSSVRGKRDSITYPMPETVTGRRGIPR